LSYFLDIEFVKCSRGLMMHQKRYPSEIWYCKLQSCNHTIWTKTLVIQMWKWRQCGLYKVQKPYRSLRYLCNTRTDLVYSVGIVSRFMDKLKVSHVAVVKRILRYVKGTIDCGIMFPTYDVGKNCK
jgi:hypothetical protein